MSEANERNLKGKLSSDSTITGTVSIGRTPDNSQVYILEDENGVRVMAVLTDEEVDLTATPNDIRIGSTAVTDDGIVTGEKEIPSYNTREGYRIITKGSRFALYTPTHYNYTKLQAIICPFNTSVIESVSAESVFFLPFL